MVVELRTDQCFVFEADTVPPHSLYVHEVELTHERWQGSPLPTQVIERYVREAVGQSITESLEDGTHFAEIPGFAGVWGEGTTQEEALSTLRSVLRSWVEFKIADHDRDIPEIAGIDLNVL